VTITERLSLIRDFHKKFGEPISAEPTLLPENMLRLRAQLILEEALELVAALGHRARVGCEDGEPVTRLFAEHDPDLVKVVDALRALEYVMGGIEVALGLQEASEETFLAVHEANMAKTPTAPGGTKPVKPEGWRPPDIRRILQKLYPTKRLLFR